MLLSLDHLLRELTAHNDRPGSESHHGSASYRANWLVPVNSKEAVNSKEWNPREKHHEHLGQGRISLGPRQTGTPRSR